MSITRDESPYSSPLATSSNYNIAILTTDTKYTTIFIQVQTHIADKQFDEAIQLLAGEVDAAERSADYYLLLSRAIHAKGLLAKAVSALDEGIAAGLEESPLIHKRNEYHSQQRKVENAIEQIANGQHTTPDVNFIKSNTKQLIEFGSYEEAIDQLSELSVARKQKTTNILWIGNYLKDIYFIPEAQPLQPKFDDLLFEEMLFYYLKACKLFEPEYKVIQEAKKALKEAEQ